MLADVLGLALENFRSPMIMCFALGAFAAIIRSDLELPPAFSKALSIYLLFAIGFKGGVSLQDDLSALLTAVPAAALLSFFLPVIAFGLLRVMTPLNRSSAAAVAAHYGSISVVTFVTAAQFLEERQVTFEGVTLAMAATMESPAIIVGLMLARAGQGVAPSRVAMWSRIKLLRRTLTHSSVVLLTGSFVIGALATQSGQEAVSPFIKGGFKGVLCLFLLDMGLLAVRSRESKAPKHESLLPVDWRLGLFALLMPPIGAGFGLLTAGLLGFGVGGKTLVAVLGASASYIAVPAAMRMALPKVNPSLYLTTSLTLTFPFNVTLGIPIYYACAAAL